MKLSAIQKPLSGAAARDQRDLRSQIADAETELSALRAIVDDLNVGILLLDRERNVQFINRAFRRFWRVPDKMVTRDLTFVRLMYHGRGMKAYAVSHDHLGDYVAKQLDLIRSGEERPLHIRFANGAVIQFRCKALPNGGRLITYDNVSELARQADEMEQLASIDVMTGLHNRRHFLVAAEVEWSRFKRYGHPLGLLLLDIDFFKSVNDTYGHDAGDEVIKGVGGILKNHKRSSDVAGRLGGEEFAVILPEATPENAVLAAERFRQLIVGHPIDVGGRTIPVTASVGVSVCRAGTVGIDELLKEADIALYKAKRTGRNRVCRFEPDEHAATAART